MLSHQRGIRDGEQYERRAAVDHVEAQPAQCGRHLGAQRREPVARRPAPAATASGAQQAAIASSCSVPSGQCGRRAASRASTSRGPQRVADPQTGQRPGLGEAAQHHHIGQPAGRPAIPARPGTASANASSTTTIRPGRRRREHRLARVQHPGRVGRVADHHQVGGLGDRRVRRGRTAAAGPPGRSGTPAAVSTASGSVNDGAISAARCGCSAGSSAKPSEPPASSSTWSSGTSVPAATAVTAASWSAAPG